MAWRGNGRITTLAGALAGALALTLLTGACSKDEPILTGKRENIRSVLDTRASGGAGAADQGTTMAPPPLRLPEPRANAEWRQRNGSPDTRPEHPALRTDAQLAWSVDIGQGDGRRNRITADPVVARGRVFTLDSEARVSAVSPAGKVLWQAVMEAPADRSALNAQGGGLAYGDGKLFVSLGYGSLVALDPVTGAVIWRQSLGSTGSGSPAVRGGLVYLVAGDEVAWVLDTENGRIRWQLSATPDLNNVQGGPAPALTDKYVVFPFGSGQVQAALRRGGFRLWDAQIAGERPGVAAARVRDITGDPLVVDDTVYTGSHSGRLVALRLGDGTRLWTANEGPLNPIWPAGGSLFLISDRNELLRLSAEDGRRLWGRPLPFFTSSRPRRQSEIVAHHGPVLAGGRLVVASNDGKLRFFDPETGAPLGARDLPGGATTNPAVAGGTLYVVSTKGQLLAYR